jgi:phosphoglycerol transferase
MTIHPSRARALALFAAMTLAFAYLLQRNVGLTPAIFADEWYYSKMARLAPLSDAMVPSYLYLWLFGASNACGPAFLDCVRLGNGLFFVGAAPFVYLVAREVAKPALALLVTLLSLCAPLNLYTSFFMPESMYYFGFWWLSWVTLTRTRWPWPAYALATGAILGLLSLVKVHALFLLPALCLFVGYVVRARGAALPVAFKAAALCALAGAALKFALAYALAGSAGLNVLGNFYGDNASRAATRTLATLLASAFVSARAHIMALGVLLGLPCALLLHGAASPAARTQAGPALARLQLYALLMLGSALAMTIMFTASIADLGPGEVLRVHMRYYSFSFPLLFAVAAAEIGRARAARPAPAWPIALVLAAVLLAAVLLLPRYVLNTVDAPDIAGVGLGGIAGRVLVGLGVVALLLWARSSKAAAPLFLFAALPLALVLGDRNVQLYIRQMVPPSAADNAGQFAHAFVPRAERKDIAVAATGLAELFRTQFHLDDKDAPLLDLPDGAPIERHQIPPQAKWLLVVGKHQLPAGVRPVSATGQYVLARLTARAPEVSSAALAAPIPGTVIAGAEGLSQAERWGRWSDGRQVVLHLQQPLPRRCTIVLTANAFRINTTLPFRLRAGRASASFRLGAAPRQVALSLVTSGSEREVSIEVPHPQSPSEVDGSPDKRKLGIALLKIAIVDDGPASLAAAD